MSLGQTLILNALKLAKIGKKAIKFIMSLFIAQNYQGNCSCNGHIPVSLALAFNSLSFRKGRKGFLCISEELWEEREAHGISGGHKIQRQQNEKVQSF